MKKVIAAVLLTVFPSSVFAQALDTPSVSQFNDRMARPSIIASFDAAPYAADMQVASCPDSKAAGRADAADQHGTVGWFLGGLAAGTGLGLIGTGIVSVAAAVSGPKAATVRAGQEETCYKDGYKGKAKNKNLVSGILGSLVGTAIWFVIIAAANSEE